MSAVFFGDAWLASKLRSAAAKRFVGVAKDAIVD